MRVEEGGEKAGKEIDEEGRSVAYYRQRKKQQRKGRRKGKVRGMGEQECQRACECSRRRIASSAVQHT